MSRNPFRDKTTSRRLKKNITINLHTRPFRTHFNYRDGSRGVKISIYWRETHKVL